jgi:hypothetical protein
MIEPKPDDSTDQLHHIPDPPKPTGDPLIDEIRRMKYDFAARFDHDLDKMFEYLRKMQDEMEAEQPGRVVHPAAVAPERPD